MLKLIMDLGAGSFIDIHKKCTVLNTEEVFSAVNIPHANEIRIIFKDNSEKHIKLSYGLLPEDFMKFLISDDDKVFRNYKRDDIVRAVSGDNRDRWLAIHDVELSDDFADFRKSIGNTSFGEALELYKTFQKEELVHGTIPGYLLEKVYNYDDIMKVHKFSSTRRESIVLSRLSYMDYFTGKQLLWDATCVGVDKIVGNLSKLQRDEIKQIVEELNGFYQAKKGK